MVKVSMDKEDLSSKISVTVGINSDLDISVFSVVFLNKVFTTMQR